MSIRKHIDIICLSASLLAILLCGILLNGETLGIQQASGAIGYRDQFLEYWEDHSNDVVMNDENSFAEIYENNDVGSGLKTP